MGNGHLTSLTCHSLMATYVEAYLKPVNSVRLSFAHC